MLSGGLLPGLVIVALAALIPRPLGRWLPETFFGLILNGVISAALLTVLAAGVFAVTYVWSGTQVGAMLGFAPGVTLGHFLRLGLSAGLLWAPVLVLSVASVPGRWKEGVW
ncbi:hypothetical protein [Pseudoroseicyclus tamaricis]|uniref:Uncharacterized protein n=1 Tax=Pseudoroseicyclus tamaricis TaxID=2705421 RepID=A0A6B2JVE6_9RHOB|nr:hypothetical protein [Pseudoroseicyclus tamaricis]NDV02318.1 hypothetical protein [Pseudoroseicyclus tamaricis]